MRSTMAALSAKKREVREALLDAPAEPVDLDAMASGRSSAPPETSPAATKAKAPEAPPPEEKPEEADDYMGRLLKAKRKAKGDQT